MKNIASALVAPLLLLSVAPGALAADVTMVAVSAPDVAVEFVLSEKIMQNLEDGQFHPEQAMSKSDFIVMVVDRFYGYDSLDTCYMNIAPKLPPNFTHLFTDVPTTSWYAKHVCLGMFTGLLSGNNDGSFKPLKGITNAEASVIISRTYGLTYPTLRPTNLKWYETPMWVLRQEGALPSKIDPAAMMTRGQVAKMLYALRTQQRFPAESTFTHAPAATIAPMMTPAFTAAPAGTTTTAPVRVYFHVPAQATTPAEPVVWTDAETAARTRRAPKISRRQLLTQMEGR